MAVSDNKMSMEEVEHVVGFGGQRLSPWHRSHVTHTEGMCEISHRKHTTIYTADLLLV